MFYYRKFMKPKTKIVIHCVTFGWKYSENKWFPFLLGDPVEHLQGALDPTLRTTDPDRLFLALIINCTTM